MQELGAEAQLQVFFQFLLSPLGLVALAVFVAVLLLVGLSTTIRWGAIALVLYVCTMATSDKEMFDNTLAFPLEQIRSNGRGIVGSLLIALLVAIMSTSRGWRLRTISGAAAAFLVFEIAFAGRLMTSGYAAKGMVSMVVYLLVFVTMTVGMGRWLQSISDVHSVLRCVVGSGALFIAASSYQIMINPSAVAWHGRFLGTTGNPQHASAFMACVMVPAAYLVASKIEPLRWKVFSGVTLGFLTGFLLWTGSRTGMLMVILGLAVTFRSRLGRLFVVVLVMATIGLLVSVIFPGSTSSLYRFGSTLDTRTRAWNHLIGVFLSHPLIGTGGVSVGESSYLATASNMGLAGLVPLCAVLLLAAKHLRGLLKIRRYLGEHSLLIDMVIATLVMIAGGAMGEGYFLGVFSFQIFMIYICLAIAMFITDVVAVYPIESTRPTAYTQPDVVAV